MGKLTLDRPVIYQIKVPGQLDASWVEWGEGLAITITSEANAPSVTTLTGRLDQAALQGLLRRLYGLGLPLISLQWVERE
ncbi:MAG: hypothetical protein H6657_08490 [Ardenticatenaceae bacterium]|nr:hypothetical protein [Ardenticatenaceae bacterium]